MLDTKTQKTFVMFTLYYLKRRKEGRGWGEGRGGERGGGGEREREIENVSITSEFFLKSLQLLHAATIQTRRKSAIIFVKYFPKSKMSKSCFHTLI